MDLRKSNVVIICKGGIFGELSLKTIFSTVLTIKYRYIADYVYALPTVAFFMTAIGIFIIGHLLSSQIFGYRKFRGPPTWQKLIALVRYLSYRGYHVKALRWNSAPVGILLLGAAGAVFFFCKSLSSRCSTLR